MKRGLPALVAASISTFVLMVITVVFYSAPGSEGSSAYVLSSAKIVERYQAWSSDRYSIYLYDDADVEQIYGLVNAVSDEAQILNESFLLEINYADEAGLYYSDLSSVLPRLDYISGRYVKIPAGEKILEDSGDEAGFSSEILTGNQYYLFVLFFILCLTLWVGGTEVLRYINRKSWPNDWVRSAVRAIIGLIIAATITIGAYLPLMMLPNSVVGYISVDNVKSLGPYRQVFTQFQDELNNNLPEFYTISRYPDMFTASPQDSDIPSMLIRYNEVEPLSMCDIVSLVETLGDAAQLEEYEYVVKLWDETRGRYVNFAPYEFNTTSEGWLLMSADVVSDENFVTKQSVCS